MLASECTEAVLATNASDNILFYLVSIFKEAKNPQQRDLASLVLRSKCFSAFLVAKTGKLADFPAALIRASAPSPRHAMQCSQPSTKPLSLAAANSRVGFNNANKW